MSDIENWVKRNASANFVELIDAARMVMADTRHMTAAGSVSEAVLYGKASARFNDPTQERLRLHSAVILTRPLPERTLVKEQLKLLRMEDPKTASVVYDALVLARGVGAYSYKKDRNASQNKL